MTMRRFAHATIAVLASSCALDFAWPLDLTTSCETDDHCPEGLVCRFNSCGRDAVGKDGEPCDLDGRCEQGLLCDEIACRKSRNNEPVPVWSRSVGNGLALNAVGVAPDDDGGAWLAFTVAGSVGVEAPVPAVDGSECFPCTHIARLARDGTLANELAYDPGVLLSSPATFLRNPLLAVDGTRALVVSSTEELDASRLRFVTTPVVTAIDHASRTVQRIDAGRPPGHSLEVIGTGSGPGGHGILVTLLRELDAFGTISVQLLVERWNATGQVSRRWRLPRVDSELQVPQVSAVAEGTTGDAYLLLAAREASALGLEGPGDFELLLPLGEDPEPEVALAVRADSLGDASLAVLPDGGAVIAVHAFTSGTVEAPPGVTRTTFATPDFADTVVVVRERDGTVRSRLIELPGIDSVNLVTFVPPSLIVLGGFFRDDHPSHPGRPPGALDADAGLVGLDLATLDIRWVKRHGDRGAQLVRQVLPSDTGLIAFGTFSSAINPGLGVLRSLSADDLFLTRYELPLP